MRLGLARCHPLLEVSPVRDQRRVEGLAVAGKGMGGAKEVAAGADLANGIEAECLIVDLERVEERLDHLDQIAIQHEFLERSDEAAFHPAGTMQNEIAATHHRAP